VCVTFNEKTKPDTTFLTKGEGMKMGTIYDKGRHLEAAKIQRGRDIDG